MGRQVFRMGLANATRHEAGDSSGGGDGTGFKTPRITRSGQNSATQSNKIPFMPAISTNSFGNNTPFYFAQKQYFLPFFSDTGGELDKIHIQAGNTVWNELDFGSGGNGFQWSLFSADSDTGFPSASVIDTYKFEPTSTSSTNTFDVRASGSRITLTEDTWYWIGFLGSSTSNGGNLNFNCFRSREMIGLQLPGGTNTTGSYYWDATQTSLKTSGFTINSSSNEFVPSQTSWIPRIYFTYLADTSNNNRWT